AVRDEVNGDRADHHEGEARVPGSEQIEEAEHLGGARHAGDGEAEAAEQPGAEGGGIGPHAEPPQRWRTTQPVAKPAIMNATVATTERSDRRLIPQTPWPLVQPLPSCVPKPTRSPATSTPPRGPVALGGRAAGYAARTRSPEATRPARNHR